MRVPCVRVRLPGRGPPRACACDRARPHTKRSESGIRIRDANPLRDAAAPPEHVLLPGTRPGDLPAPRGPAAIATARGLAVRPFILSFIPTQSELRTHLPQALSQAPAVVG